MSTDLFLKRCVSSGSESLSLAICLFYVCFVGCLSMKFWLCLFITLRVPFTSERFCGDLLLGLSPLAPL